MRRTFSALMLFVLVALTHSSVAAATASQKEANESVIASKNEGDLLIDVTTKSTGFTSGEIHFCVTFRNLGGPAPVKEVAADFSLTVGRIRESAIRARLSRQETGSYCGIVELGSLYHSPSTYHLLGSYLDATGKKQKVWFWVTAR